MNTPPSPNMFGNSSSYVLDISPHTIKVSSNYAELDSDYSHTLEWQPVSVDFDSLSNIQDKNRFVNHANENIAYITKHLWINGVGLVVSFFVLASALFLHTLPLIIISFIIMLGFFEMLLTVMIDKRASI